MRIVLTVPSLAREFGGPAGKALDLTNALRDLGHDVRLAGAGESETSATVGLGRRGSFHGTPVPARTRPLRRLVGAADVVHVLGYRDPVGTVAALTAHRHGVPYVLEPAGMIQRRLRSLALKGSFDSTIGRAVAGRAAALVVASSVEADDLARAGIFPDRVRIRPNGVDFDELLPLPGRGPLRERLGIPADAPLILTLARIGQVKGLATMGQALGSLPGVWWLLAGPNEHDGALAGVRAALRNAAAIDRAVILTDGIWGEDKRAALAEADLFCLPSTYESFGTAALEAAGVGIPVVVTMACGVKDVLEAGASRVVPAGDPTALAEAMKGVMGHSSSPTDTAGLRNRMDWRSLAEEQVAIYATALSGR